MGTVTLVSRPCRSCDGEVYGDAPCRHHLLPCPCATEELTCPDCNETGHELCTWCEERPAALEVEEDPVCWTCSGELILSIRTRRRASRRERATANAA